MEVQKSYKDGMIEGVVFCFYSNGRVLLEDRGKGFNNEAFFPNGTIELKDKSEKDYVMNALYREVSEEFAGQITIKSKRSVGELTVPQVNVLFYIYVITNWDGEFPKVIKEEGEVDSKINFFSIEKQENFLNMIVLLRCLKWY